jgi:hypothetical protein
LVIQEEMEMLCRFSWKDPKGECGNYNKEAKQIKIGSG